MVSHLLSIFLVTILVAGGCLLPCHYGFKGSLKIVMSIGMWPHGSSSISLNYLIWYPICKIGHFKVWTNRYAWLSVNWVSVFFCFCQWCMKNSFLFLFSLVFMTCLLNKIWYGWFKQSDQALPVTLICFFFSDFLNGKSCGRANVWPTLPRSVLVRQMDWGGGGEEGRWCGR
jgi:hypothetical protein